MEISLGWRCVAVWPVIMLTLGQSGTLDDGGVGVDFRFRVSGITRFGGRALRIIARIKRPRVSQLSVVVNRLSNTLRRRRDTHPLGERGCIGTVGILTLLQRTSLAGPRGCCCSLCRLACRLWAVCLLSLMEVRLRLRAVSSQLGGSGLQNRRVKQ